MNEVVKKKRKASINNQELYIILNVVSSTAAVWITRSFIRAIALYKPSVRAVSRSRHNGAASGHGHHIAPVSALLCYAAQRVCIILFELKKSSNKYLHRLNQNNDEYNSSGI